MALYVVASSSPSLAAKKECDLRPSSAAPSLDWPPTAAGEAQAQSRGHEKTQATPHYPCWWVCSMSAELAEASPRPEGLVGCCCHWCYSPFSNNHTSSTSAPAPQRATSTFGCVLDAEEGHRRQAGRQAGRASSVGFDSLLEARRRIVAGLAF